jgi:hypothetical protein
VGLTHLATLDHPVPGLTDESGHIFNPRVLDSQVKRLATLDRAWARTKQGSKNRAKLRRAGLRPETLNADPRPHQTEGAQAPPAAAA